MNKEKLYPFEPDYSVVPGETLREVIDSLGTSQRDLALRMGLTVQSVSRILKGDQPITHETANRLELVTGVPARFWNNLEALYREQLTKIEERQRLKKDVEWLKTIPLKELIERGQIERQDDQVSHVREVLRFYGVSSVEAWYEVWMTPDVAARRSTCFESLPGPTSAWLRIGELSARNIDCRPYDRAAFTEAQTAIRSLTRKAPEEFVPQMKELCARSGVALVLVPEMKKVPWNGATKWLTPFKAMILLNLRGKAEDRFWFSFFHEAGHVVHSHKTGLYIAGDQACADDPNRDAEIAADRFAEEFLIPRKYNERIRGIRSKVEVVAVADALDVSPAIVVGRYHYLTNNWNFYNDLVRTFRWNT